MEKYGFVYIWFDSAKSKIEKDEKKIRFYIGAHWGREDDGYISSSKWLNHAKVRRPLDFKRRILSRHFSKDETFQEEYRILNMIKKEELKIRYYNLHTSLLNIGMGNNTQFQKGLIPWNKGKGGYTTSAKDRLSPNKGISMSNEQKIKIGESNKGKPKSAYERQPHSEEVKEKISQTKRGQKYPNRKRPTSFSEEHRQKLKEAQKKRREKERSLPT